MTDKDEQAESPDEAESQAEAESQDERAEADEADPEDQAEAAEATSRKGMGFGQSYYMLNSIEAFERLAYFGIRAVVPIYIMQATEPGGLHLTALDKGWIYMWWALFQSFLPIVTGGYADRYGYKRVLGFAISANVVGYLMMAFLRGYYGFFAGILVLATGTAFFKPSLQGSLAQNLTKDNSSLGWGIFYWVVNVGAFAAPFLATIILGRPHSAEGWRNLFLASAGYTSVNLLLLFTFKDVPSGASKTEGAWQVMSRTLRNILDVRLLIWLAIMSCFWLMMYQLWDLHPNFIEDWIDSAAVAESAPFESWREYGDRGLLRVPQQILLNLNAGLIIILILPISWLVRRMRTLSAMLIGMTVATVGILVAGLTNNGWVLLLGILFFSLGEMLTGPKKNEYLGLIAPPGKKAMYLGYVNIPIGVGVGIGSLIAGYVYDQYGEKATLALKYLGEQPQLVAKAARSADWSDALDRVVSVGGVERSRALALASKSLGVESSRAADRLVETYRYDRGQITNLALQYLALHPEFRAEAQAAVDDGATLNEETVARWVGKLPKAIGVNRSEALERVRFLMSKKAAIQETAVVDELWATYGRQPENLVNLALEYLAQGTPLVERAVAKMSFPDPVRDIPDKVGIGRTKSFTGLSAARGATETEVEQKLAAELASVSDPDDRVVVYLIGLKHQRFNAVARKNWTRDVDQLDKLVRDDPASVTAVRQHLGTTGPLDYAIVAERQEVVQAALDAKDWSKTPDQAARLLGLNPHEAKALAGAELAKSPLSTTKLLWEQYHPQYRVWIPFAIIGFLAAIALGIFGQRAKRWKDMNA